MKGKGKQNSLSAEPGRHKICCLTASEFRTIILMAKTSLIYKIVLLSKFHFEKNKIK